MISRGNSLPKKNVIFIILIGKPEEMIKPFSNPYRDRDIISNIREGRTAREKAMKTLLLNHQGFIGKGQKEFQISREEARDAYHDALIGLMKMVLKDDFQQKAKLSTILYSIFYRKCIDLRQKGRINVNAISWEQVFPGLNLKAIDFLDKLFAKETLEQIHRILPQIGKNCMELLFFQAQGFEDSYIAEMLGYKNSQTVKNRRKECRIRLSKHLKKYSD